MRFTPFLFVLFLICSRFPENAVAQTDLYRVEIDLGGQVGNGPDLIEVEVSDYVTGDLWLDGPLPLIYLGVTACNFDGSLERQGTTISLPDGWVETPGFPPSGCFEISGIDNTGSNPLLLPAIIGSFTYHAAVDQSVDDLSFFSSTSGWVNTQYESGNFDQEIGATIRIGGTGTQSSGWGRIKAMFR